MKKIIFHLVMLVSLAAFSQKTNLSIVNTVKPKKGQKMAFEAAYKAHVAKFHKADNATEVYEVLSGPNIGSYHIVSSGKSFADFDKERADAMVHSLDLDKTFFPLLDETMNGTYRFVDSLSLQPDTTSEKYLVVVRHLKNDLAMGDYYKELARGVKINKALQDPFFKNLSYNFFEQIWDGSDQVTVSIRNLKEGFKSLEPGYYGTAPAGTPTFRDEYVKTYGYEDWEKRVKLFETAVVKTEQYTMKLRKDLSTQ